MQAWGDHVIGRLRPKAKALFQAGRFIGVEDERAVFGLPNEIHRARCEEMRGEIESALADHFGRAVRLTWWSTPESATGPAASPGRHLVPVDTRSRHPAGPIRRPGPAVPTGPSDPAARCPAGSRSLQADDLEDLSAFDESELGDVADVDNSAESRVMQAFPGAEEVG